MYDKINQHPDMWTMCVPRVGGYFREDRARTTMRISGARGGMAVTRQFCDNQSRTTLPDTWTTCVPRVGGYFREDRARTTMLALQKTAPTTQVGPERPPPRSSPPHSIY